MKLHDAKANLKQAINLLQSLKANPSDDIDEEAITIKNNIDTILSKFSPETISDLKKKMHVRRRKRAQIKRRKERFCQYKQDVSKLQAEENKNAEAVFVQWQEKEASLKAEESVRRQADVVLNEVTRRKAEARRFLALLPALAKLRAARSQQYAATGGNPSAQVAQDFDTVLQRIRSLWEKQLASYVEEEAGLKVLLNEGSISKLGRMEREVDENMHQWMLAMFGEGDHKEMTWPQLVSIRSSWDRFLATPDTPMSSMLPQGWVLPQPILSDDWKDKVHFDS